MTNSTVELVHGACPKCGRATDRYVRTNEVPDHTCQSCEENR